MHQYEVIVVGAGPSGLLLSHELGRRGVRTLLLEQADAPGPWPKMERCNARTMEFFRRAGIVEEVRAVGLAEWAPMDVFIVTSLDEPPVVRIPFPSVSDYRAKIASLNDGSVPREPYQLVSQYALEPLLVDIVRRNPAIELRFGARIVGLEQDEAGVTASFETAEGVRQARAAYLVGCDGGSSFVRKQAGIVLEGDGRLRRMTQVQFRSETLYDQLRYGKGRHFQCFDANGSTIIVQGNRKDFTLNTGLLEGDFAAEIRRFVGFPFEFEILRTNGWTQNLLVADRFRAGRVFIVGDAAHLVIPTGGLGMNTAVGDAFDLGWKLAGTLQGWGGPALLDSYDFERRRVAFVNREASRWAAGGMAKWRTASRAEAFEQTPGGASARAELAGVAYPLFRRVHEMHGTELGYHYAGSPLIANENMPPPWEISAYRPSTVPGARLPHMWMADGSALFDRIGEGFTLIDLTGEARTAMLEQAFVGRDAPLDILRADEPHIRSVYGADLLLVRPDLHIVWRGSALPADVDGLASVATGYRPDSAADAETPEQAASRTFAFAAANPPTFAGFLP